MHAHRQAACAVAASPAVAALQSRQARQDACLASQGCLRAGHRPAHSNPPGRLLPVVPPLTRRRSRRCTCSRCRSSHRWRRSSQRSCRLHTGAPGAGQVGADEDGIPCGGRAVLQGSPALGPRRALTAVGRALAHLAALALVLARHVGAGISCGGRRRGRGVARGHPPPRTRCLPTLGRRATSQAGQGIDSEQASRCGRPLALERTIRDLSDRASSALTWVGGQGVLRGLET
jgi:hypothetical protein